MALPFAQPVPLVQLLSNPYVLQAPPYQRSFAWTEEEAGRLLDDIAAAMDEGGESDYFLGAMLFTEAEVSALRLATRPLLRTPRTLEIVDGLQRLTTLTILFSILRDIDMDDGERPLRRSNVRKRRKDRVGQSEEADVSPRKGFEQASFSGR